MTVFADSGGGNFSVTHIGNELCAVANTQHWYAQFQNCFIIMRRSFIIDAVRSARKNDAFIVVFFYFLDRCGKRQDLRINMLLTNSACNQLIILSAEIQH
ncbi:hypothetical protein SDC9_100288 [bioreactor metagenome]|uniref:Uncharacterized protein n=1 Tax=bioreactor metagenome TaxID=1076179 RepID=A0A645AK74_9ZZZZ